MQVYILIMPKNSEITRIIFEWCVSLVTDKKLKFEMWTRLRSDTLKYDFHNFDKIYISIIEIKSHVIFHIDIL